MASGWREGIQWEDPSSMATRDDYIVHDGRRYVKPYFFQFVAHVSPAPRPSPLPPRATTLHRTALPLPHPSTCMCIIASACYAVCRHAEEAVREGRIQVDGRNVAPDYAVRQSQTMTHYVHRHEPWVDAAAVEVLHESDTVLVVCKPSSMPVHPCGQYRKNTVLSVLQAFHGYGQLFPIHRLDRSVSGLLILAKSAAAAETFRLQMMSGQIHKQYIARVTGTFPPNPVEVSAPVVYDARMGVSRVVTTPAPPPDTEQHPTALQPMCDKESVGQEGTVVETDGGEQKEKAGKCDGEEKAARPRKARDVRREKAMAKRQARVQAKGAAGAGGGGAEDDKEKAAVTVFERQAVAGDGTCSIVRCSPRTGRTHQIRVHLQHVGHPVANDDLYLPPPPHVPPALQPLPSTRATSSSWPSTASLPVKLVTTLASHAAAAAAAAAADCKDEDNCRSGDGASEAEVKGSSRGTHTTDGRDALQESGGVEGRVSEKEGGLLGRHGGSKGGNCSASDDLGAVRMCGEGKRACKAARVQQDVCNGAAPSPGRVHTHLGAEGGGEARDQERECGLGAQGAPSCGDEDGAAGATVGSHTARGVAKEEGIATNSILNEGATEGGVKEAEGKGGAVEAVEEQAEGNAAAAPLLSAAAVPCIPQHLTDPLCPHCPLIPAEGVQVEQHLWLHCCRYSGPDWCFECPMPPWAHL
ncbi:unnamed protein product [Closterium sp. Yama58-4]|nr:unnamed protein product [Closterium sp. Yama58-4]